MMNLIFNKCANNNFVWGQKHTDALIGAGAGALLGLGASALFGGDDDEGGSPLAGMLLGGLGGAAAGYFGGDYARQFWNQNFNQKKLDAPKPAAPAQSAPASKTENKSPAATNQKPAPQQTGENLSAPHPVWVDAATNKPLQVAADKNWNVAQQRAAYLKSPLAHAERNFSSQMPPEIAQRAQQISERLNSNSNPNAVIALQKQQQRENIEKIRRHYELQQRLSNSSFTGWYDANSPNWEAMANAPVPGAGRNAFYNYASTGRDAVKNYINSFVASPVSDRGSEFVPGVYSDVDYSVYTPEQIAAIKQRTGLAVAPNARVNEAQAFHLLLANQAKEYLTDLVAGGKLHPGLVQEFLRQFSQSTPERRLDLIMTLYQMRQLNSKSEK